MTGGLGDRYARAEPWLILFALAGLASVTLSGQGSYKPFVYLLELLVLVHVGRALWERRPVRREAFWLALTPAAFLLCDVLAPAGVGDKHAAQNAVGFAAVAGAAWILPRPWPARPAVLYDVLITLLAAIALAHAVTVWLYLEPHGFMDNPQLLSHNPHFIALQAAAVAPLMAHAALGGRPVQWVALAGLGAALVTLIELPSLIGIVCLGAAGLTVATLRLPPRGRRLAGAAALVGVVVVVVYPVLAGPLEPTLDRLASEAGFRRLDERIGIWAEAWQLQQQASGVEWLVGHGLGAFEAHFPDEWVFPHHFALEVLYNSGLLGLAAFAASLIALGVVVARGLRGDGAAIRLALALLVVVGLFTFLTLPLTARVTAHAHAMVVGFALWAAKGSATASES